jgi:hypothetical protein
MKRLDLHGLRHDDARKATIRFIEENWNSDDEAQIVTGNSNYMQRVVIDVLNEYKLNYKRGSAIYESAGFITTWFD